MVLEGRCNYSNGVAARFIGVRFVIARLTKAAEAISYKVLSLEGIGLR
jgi:hypothetical protein